MGLDQVGKFDCINQMITLSVITLSRFHCTMLLLLKAIIIKQNLVGPNNLYTKIPWDILRRKTPKFRGMCWYYFSAPPNILLLLLLKAMIIK